jgi:hypothetical protein
MLLGAKENSVARSRRNIYLLAAAAAALATAFLLPGRAAAVAGTPDSGFTTGPGTTVQVAATGLNVPRSLVYDREHNRLLIAEAGVAAGNTGPCAAGDAPSICYGATGSVYSFSLDPNGKSGRIITGLPSFSNAAKNFVQGLDGLSLYHGKLTGAFSLSGTVATRTGLGPGAADLGQAVVFGPSGQVTPIADVAALEAKLYGPQAASSPWGVTTGAFGTLIADSDGTPAAGSLYGGNDVLWLRHGDLTQLVAFPQRTLAGTPADTVLASPDAVVQGPDGAFYVGELTSYPYYPGSARIWRVVPGQAPTVYASGLSKVIDFAFDSQGRLLVLENGGRLSPAQLVRVAKDGTQTVLVGGLNAPDGLVAVNDHTYYVSNIGGGTGGDGQLLKVTVSG